MTQENSSLTQLDIKKCRTGIVVAGFNACNHIVASLSAAMKTALPIVYADMASVDDSVDFARTLAKNYPLKVCELSIDKPLSRARASNEGAALLLKNHPHLEFIQFMRVGCNLENGWIQLAQKTFDDHPRLGALAGLSFSKNKKGREVLQFVDLTQGYLSDLNGGDFIVRANLLRQLKGFDEIPRLGFETEFMVRAKEEGFFARRSPDRMMTIEPAQARSFMKINSFFRQGYIQYYLIFKAPSARGRIIFLARSVWVSFWTLWLPGATIGLGVWLSPQYFSLLWLYGILVFGFFIRRRLRIKTHEPRVQSLQHAVKMSIGFWTRLRGHFTAFRDLSTAETEKLFSMKGKRFTR